MTHPLGFLARPPLCHFRPRYQTRLNGGSSGGVVDKGTTNIYRSRCTLLGKGEREMTSGGKHSDSLFTRFISGPDYV